MFDASRGFALGLVNRIVPPGEALDVAIGLAERIAANGPLAVVACKRVMRLSRDWPSDEMFALQREITEPVQHSQGAREGALAFAQKRKPLWRGA